MTSAKEQAGTAGRMNLDDIRPVIAQPQTFSSTCLDPASQLIYNGLSTKHMSSAAVLTSVNQAGNHLNSTVNGQFVSLKGNMSYSELLAGLLFRGENLIQYGHFNFLQYSYVAICDENNTTVSTRNSGVCLLTDKRILFLSSQVSQSTSLGEWGDTKKLPGGYTLTTNLGDTTAYLPIPLRFFRSVEMMGQSGVKGEVMVSGQKPCCGGLCGLCGVCCSMVRMLKQWTPGTVVINQHSQMSVSLGVLMPPWERRMYLHIHVSPNTPIPVIRDFIAVLQQHATGLN